jgi:DNA-binding LytR/AlgR family response regulator
MIRYLALDDDENQLKSLMDKLASIPQTKMLASFTSSKEAFDYLQHNKVDVAFLDIEMPGLSGIDLAAQLTDPPLFVFVTSHPKFALNSYELDAVDYLLKPVTIERLLVCFKKIHRLLDLIKVSSNEMKSDHLKEQSFYIKESSQFVKVDYDQVLYAESHNNFVSIYLTNGKKHLVLVNMKNFEEQVPHSYFIRISRTHLVNKQKISSFNTDTVFLGSISLAIGTTYQQSLHDMANELHLITRYKR